jgi:nitrogen fixation protein
MSDIIDINVSKTVETIDIVANFEHPNIEITAIESVDNVEINAVPNVVQVNINTVIGSGAEWGEIDGTLSDQTDLQDALDLKANTSELGAVAFSNDYNDLDNLPTIPETVTKTSDLINDGEDGVNPFITLEDIPPVTGFVPYTGANQNVNLGEFEIKAGQFTLDTSPTGTATVGTTRWNNTLGSTETTLKGGSVILKNGVDLVARVVNKVTPNTTLTKANYAAVRVSGAQGQRLAVAYAQANNDLNSADTIGLVCETIPTNQEGFILTVGQLEGINTTGNLQGETWSDGDVIYLSPTVAGKLTNIKPTAPQHIVIVGYVEYAHANNGKLYVKIMNGWELEELHNVGISGLTNNDFLYYDSGTSLWRNRQITPSFVLGTGTTSQYLRGDNTWVNLPVQNLATTGPVAITITAIGVANLQNLSGHSFTINESVMPVGGLIQINGYVDRTAGSGAGNLAYDINGTKRYINTPSGSQYQYQFSFYRESATILRMMGGTSAAPYQGSFGSANAISASVTLTAGGNITFQLQGWGTVLNDVHTYRFFKAILIR